MDVSTKELKPIARIRGIKGYKSMSEDEVLSALNLSKPVKKGKKIKPNFSKARIEKIRKEFNESRYKVSKLKIKEIRKNLYKIENEKNLSESKIKEIERNLTELEENISKTKKCYNYDNIEYRRIKNVRDLFNLSIDEDYYKPIIARGPFNSSYIQYESKRDKGKSLSIKKYLNMIKPYLSYIINDHKTRGLVRYHSGNKTWVKHPPKWLKNKKATINPKNKDDKWFQYALTVTLNYEQIKNNPQGISNTKSSSNKCNWKEIYFRSHSKDLSQKINQLLLLFCICLIIQKNKTCIEVKI